MPISSKQQEDAEDEDVLFEEELPDEDHYGRLRYLEACKQAGISPISQVLKYLETELMQVMHYGLNVRDTKALCAALRVNQNLRVLRLSDNAIPDDGIKVLCDALAESPNCAIIDLDLSANRMASHGCGALCELLTLRSCTLKGLGLAKMHLGEREGMTLASALEGNTTLRTLDLSDNDLGERSATAFGHMLSANLSLTDLNLSWNKLRPKGVAALAEGLKPNVTLQVLGLAWCGMQDAGADALGTMLHENQGLADVDVCGNALTGAGAKSLAAGVGVCPTLAGVRLNNNDLREDGVHELLGAVEKNKGIVLCEVDNTNCSEALRTAMEAILEPRRRLKGKLRGGAVGGH